MTTVREARAEESDGIRSLLNAAYRQYAVDMPAELYRRYLADLTDLDRGHATMLVALQKEKLVGTVRFYPAGMVDELALPADWAWCRAVAVHPDRRRAGIGHALLADCVRRAGETGAAARVGFGLEPLGQSSGTGREGVVSQRMGYGVHPQPEVLPYV